MKNWKKAKIIFKDELCLIKDPDIVNLVNLCFENLTPEYFWEAPASSSSLHHPTISNKKGGVVLHTKLAVWWGMQLFHAHPQSDIEIITAALLLHDLQKFGPTYDNNYNKESKSAYGKNHGLILANYIEELIEGNSSLSRIKDLGICTFDIITASIALHMGIWTGEVSNGRTYSQYENDINVKIVHLADYISSRKVDGKLREMDCIELDMIDLGASND